MRTMICANPLDECKIYCRHRGEHGFTPDCLIPCPIEDRICKEVEEKTDWELVAQQQG